MSPVDSDLLSQAAAAAGLVTELEVRLAGAKADYRRSVRRLHLAGATMREVAEALGVSHQRVHQIIEKDGGVRRWRRRRAQEPAGRECSFCGREQHEVRKLVAGPGVFICDPCILAAVGVTTSGRAARDPAMDPVAAGSAGACGFCGKDRGDVRALVRAGARPHQGAAGNAVICDECLGLCGEILSEQLR